MTSTIRNEYSSLLSNIPRRIQGDEWRRFITNLSANATTNELAASLNQYMNIIRIRAAEIAESLRNGHVPLRFLGMICGIVMSTNAVCNFIRQMFLRFDIPIALVEVYVLCLSQLMLLIESHLLAIPKRYIRLIYKYAQFQKFVWGRGGLYFVAASTQLAIGKGLGNIFVSLFGMIVGVFFIVLGYRFIQKLTNGNIINRTRSTPLVSDRQFRDTFRQHDKERKSFLSADQLQALLSTLLGWSISQYDFEMCLMYLDDSDSTAGEESLLVPVRSSDTDTAVAVRRDDAQNLWTMIESNGHHFAPHLC